MLDSKLQLFFDMLDWLNNQIFFRWKCVQVIPPIFIDFFYEGYRMPWLAVLTGFFTIHALLFSLENSPILPTLSVEQCKNQYYVSNPVCKNMISPWYVAAEVESFQVLDEDVLPWYYLSLAGCFLVGMANSMFHWPWWIFAAVYVEYLVALGYFYDLEYCPRFNGAFQYNPMMNSTTYEEEYYWYTHQDALQFYNLSNCDAAEDLMVALTNIVDAVLQANICICDYYPHCCGL